MVVEGSTNIPMHIYEISLPICIYFYQKFVYYSHACTHHIYVCVMMYSFKVMMMVMIMLMYSFKVITLVLPHTHIYIYDV